MNSRQPLFLTATRATSAGRGAVATILIHRGSKRGGEVVASLPFQAVNGNSILEQPLNRIVFGRWGAAPGEEVVVCRTSDCDWEIHCHGGFAATERILADLQAAGATILDWDEQVARQYGQLRRECELALTQAVTLRTASLLLTQEAAWRRWAAGAEHSIQTSRRDEVSESIRQILNGQDLGRHLTEPFRVVLTGKPNVGKSSLINALVGFQRSIVFDQPGTTRDVVTAETAWDGWPVLLADTAGLRPDATGLEASGIKLARDQIARADLLLLVHDASEQMAGDQTAGDDLLDSMQGASGDPSRTIRVANKIDLVTPGIDHSRQSDFAVSAVTGEGLEQLISAAGARLVTALPDPGTPLPFSNNLVVWLEQLLTLTAGDHTHAAIAAHFKTLLANEEVG